MTRHRQSLLYLCKVGIYLIFSGKAIGMILRCQRVRLGVQKGWFHKAIPSLLQGQMARPVFWFRKCHEISEQQTACA